MRFQAPKGTQDITPPQVELWQWVEQKFFATAKRFGFGEIRIPTFEATELYQRGVGDGTDVVQKEMYTFTDKGGRSITLRPEGTAGVVRSYIENGMASWTSPVKLFYNHTFFRYEKMQKGRLREFHQFGAESIGSASPLADAELIGMVFAFFGEVGIDDIQLRLNSIGCPTCRQTYLAKLKAYFEPLLGTACETCQTRFHKNTLRMLDCKEHSCQKNIADAPRMLDHLCPDCQTHWDELLQLLEAAKIDFVIDSGIVRGLDYYNRTVFELVSVNVGAQGTICGGGRYDTLVEELGGTPTPAIGFGMGIERLLLELEARDITPSTNAEAKLAIAYFPQTASMALALAQTARQSDINVCFDTMGRSLKAQLKLANKMQATHVIVVGEDEAKNNQAMLRSLSDKSECSVALDNIATIIDGLKKVV